MKGELITDFSKLKIGDKIEKYNNIYTFINITDNGDTVNVLRKDGKTDMFNNKNWYHHIEDKQSIIDYVGKWYYDTTYGDLGMIDVVGKRLTLQMRGYYEENIELLKCLIDDKTIIIRDTLEEIKQVYREYNR